MTERAHDAIAAGAFERVARPAPHGVDELGRRLLKAHGGVDAALGALALWLIRLEAKTR
jgi:hypothetical protein